MLTEGVARPSRRHHAIRVSKARVSPFAACNLSNPSRATEAALPEANASAQDAICCGARCTRPVFSQRATCGDALQIDTLAVPWIEFDDVSIGPPNGALSDGLTDCKIPDLSCVVGSTRTPIVLWIKNF